MKYLFTTPKRLWCFQIRETLLQKTSNLQPLDEGFSFTGSRVSSGGVTLQQISGFFVTV